MTSRASRASCCLRWVLGAVLGLAVAAAAGATASAADAGAGTSCGSDAGGTGGTSCGAGPASQGNTSGTNQGAGNPIHLITGNKYQMEVDMPPLPGVLGLELVRHYNSVLAKATDAPGLLGRGWKLSYETRLYPDSAHPRILQADGTRIVFACDPRDADAACTHANGLTGRLVRQVQRQGTSYVWIWPNGRRLLFDTRGQLLQIAAPTGEFVTLRYDADGHLLRVTDPQGRSLHLQRPGHEEAQADRHRARYRGVHRIDTPLGAVEFRYTYTVSRSAVPPPFEPLRVANLVQVTQGEVERRYHYEDPRFPGLLTGIGIQGQGSDGKALQQRIGTYAYDVGGRAILSVRGEGGERIVLDHRTPGQTLLTDAQGRKTVYKYAMVANEWRLLQVRGPGCESCGESNVAYGYDNAGRLVQTTLLADDGSPRESTRRWRDTMGRIVRIEQLAHAGRKPLAARLLMRYEYTGDAVEPSLIAWPSVVEGRERQLRIAYNAQHQPVQVVETGFSPLDARGLPAANAAQASAIARTTELHYRTVNGRSVLAQIDKPLPNGPAAAPEDSDITRFAWDESGSAVVAITLPGATTVRLLHDAAGRVLQRQLEDGARRVQTDIRYADFMRIHQEPESVVRSAWMLQDGQPDASTQLTVRVLDARHDALGRRSRSGSDGQPAQTMAYDSAGRPDTWTNTQGDIRRWVYGDAGQLLATVTQDAHGKVRDGQLWLASGDGRLRAVVGLQKVERAYAYLDEGIAALEKGEFAPPFRRAGATERAPDRSDAHRARAQDDFGRLVWESHPEDGSVRNDYRMEPGQWTLVQTRLANDGVAQIVETLVFDHADRLRERRRAGCTERLLYAGPLLQRLQGCDGTHRFERDAFGQITQTWQKQGGGGSSDSHDFVQRFSYDGFGRLQARDLVDGHRLRYAYGEDGSIRTVRLQRTWLSWLAYAVGTRAANAIAKGLPQWLATQAVVQDTPRPPLGAERAPLRRAAYGNGENQHGQVPLPRAGPLASAADAWGRQTHHVPASGPNKDRAQRLVWNDMHQLVAIEDVQSGARVASYAYDSLGNRVAKIDARGVVTRYVYDMAHRLIAQADASGRVLRHYLYTGHRVHSVLENGKLYAVQTDWRGLPEHVTDAQQREVWRGAFDAWGQSVAGVESENQAAFDMPLRLAGQYFDAESGLHYNIHRYFDPRARRYLSPDPLGVPDGEQRYAYLQGDPHAGIDPLGLFKVPTLEFFGLGFFLPKDDGGHANIVRAAFAQYNRNGLRFSTTLIDQIVQNNYHTDAATAVFGGTGGQFKKTNHFDNPNDGPMYKDAQGRELLPAYRDGKSDQWIADSLDQIDALRTVYGKVGRSGENDDISRMLSAFGQNTHTLADFYAHSNWVDASSRGGCVHNEAQDPVLGKVTEDGYVPVGLNQTRLWAERRDAIPMSRLYTGTVQPSNVFCTGWKGDVECKDATTHGYWSKDAVDEPGGQAAYTADETRRFTAQGMSYWVVETFNPGRPPLRLGSADSKDWGTYGVDYFSDTGQPPRHGDRIYVARPITNRHEMAFYLAVEATKNEIKRLYEQSAGVRVGNTTLHAVFQLNDLGQVGYTTLWPKK
jgi:RHS repeat-associated protein